MNFGYKMISHCKFLELHSGIAFRQLGKDVVDGGFEEIVEQLQFGIETHDS